MKKNMTIFLVTVMSLLAVHQRNARADLSDGLIAWYPFNGNADDASGNGNHGTVLGAGLTEDICNDANNAYAFDGVNDYVLVVHDSSLANTEGTISIWFKMNNLSRNIVFSKDVGGCNGDCGHLTMGYGGWYWANKFGFRLQNDGNGSHYSLMSDDSLLILTTGTWYHAVITFGPNGIRLYMNGVEHDYDDNTKGMQNNDLPLNIGRSYDGYYFNGMIDEVRIYNRDLNASEIGDLYNQGVLCCVPPTITEHPSSPSLPICEGQSHEYCVIASGSEPLSYQWQKDDSNIPGATFSCYTAGEAGSYRCVVSNSCGSATSNSATLGVNTAPVITVHPQDQTVCDGNSVQFCVTATAASSYQWKKDGGDIPGATGSCYTIDPVTAADAGNYTCVVSNSCGSTESNVATLTVNTAPVITVHPQDQTVCDGNSVQFCVTATAASSYQWKKDGGDIPGATSSCYTASEGGSYRCVVSNSCGSATSNPATITVCVNPLITQQPQDATVSEGEDAVFTVAASGCGPFQYQWKNNGVNVGGDSNSLPLYSVQLSDNNSVITLLC